MFSVAVLVAYVIAQGWKDASVWGAFGDFLGGILNPVFAFANVIILVVISYQLAEIEETRAEKDRASQERLSKFGMQYTAIQEVNSFQYETEKAVATYDVDQIEELRSRIFQAIARYQILFPSLETFDLISVITNFRYLADAAGSIETLEMMERDLDSEDLGEDFAGVYSTKVEEFRKHIPPVYEILNSLQRAMARDIAAQNSFIVQ